MPSFIKRTEGTGRTDAGDPPLRIGIGITTFNRREMLRNTIAQVRRFTKEPHHLFVADDGSSDGTAALLADLGVAHLSASNRGIAWNKNRALYYLRTVRECDVIILLEDDTFPNAAGWESVWIEAALRYGHMNLAPSHWTHPYLGGSGTVADPYVSRLLTGQCCSFSRSAIDLVGYVDTRFRRYGFEHVDHTHRFIMAGFAGLIGAEPHRFRPYLIESHLTVSGLDKAPDMDGVHHNAPIFMQLQQEQIHRWAWRGDEELAIFRAEQASVSDPAAGRRAAGDGGPEWFVQSWDGLPLVVKPGANVLLGAAPAEGDGKLMLRQQGRSGHLGVWRDGRQTWLSFTSHGAFHEVDNIGISSPVDFVSAPGPGFGLRLDGSFLCCDVTQEGAVGFNRPHMSEWETFRFGGYAIG